MKKEIKISENYTCNYRYEVIFIDEYNNMYLIGFFNDLKEAEPEINEMLKDYRGLDEEGEEYIPQLGDEKLGHLEEYPSTYNYCFDMEIPVEEGCVQVRGFVFE